MGKKKKQQFNDISSSQDFGPSFRKDVRHYDSKRYGRPNFYKYDRYSYQSKYKKDFHKKKNKPNKRYPSRPQSPVRGTQEYMEKKIEQTSAIIMRQLLNPNETLTVNLTNEDKKDKNASANHSNQEHTKSIDIQTVNNKNKKKLSSQEVEEIHTRIMCHLTNLNYGRKRNLINASNSGYDTTIQHFVKQQRLEISRALRTMCSSNQFEEQNEIINSIIPDIGIKIEELPKDVIEELSHSFGCDFNVDFNSFENYTYLTDDVNTVTELEPIQINIGDSFVRGEMVVTKNATLVEGAQSSKNETNLPLPSNPEIVNTNEATKEDNDVIVIEEGEEIIEIGDEDVRDSEEVKKVVNIGEVSIELMKDEQDVRYSPKMVDLILITPESNERIDGVVEEDDSNETVKNEGFEVTDNVILKTEIDDENVSIDVDENSKKCNIAQDEILEDLKPIINTKEMSCEMVSKNLKVNPEPKDSSTQTEIKENPVTIDLLIETNFGKKPSNLYDAVARMIQIDQWISKLTSFRQDMFRQFASDDGNEKKDVSKNDSVDDGGKILKKRKIVNDEVDVCDNETTCMEISEDCIEEITFDDIDDSSVNDTLMKFDEIDDIIVVVKVFKDKLVAGSESGKIYICSINDGKFLQILRLQSGVPITSLLLVEDQTSSMNMYIGTFRDHLHVYSFDSYYYLKSITVEDSVHCMDSKWGYIFIGCTGGWLQRYRIERESMEQEKFNDGTILALKATVEGPRRILLVASEESPLCIRDAMTGLQLRRIARLETYSVHCMIIDKNLIYCGTHKGELLILSFHKGIMLQTAKIPSALGKICMKLYRNILFISRDKDVHLYDMKAHKFIGEINGPGGSILSMEIVRNQLILGTNSRKFNAVPIEWNAFKNR